jgi:hypothetical protein
VAILVGPLRYPMGVNGIFNSLYLSGHVVALGSTKSLTEMSTKDIPWGVKTAGA